MVIVAEIITDYLMYFSVIVEEARSDCLALLHEMVPPTSKKTPQCGSS